jgi:hypothetical protein
MYLLEYTIKPPPPPIGVATGAAGVLAVEVQARSMRGMTRIVRRP